MRHRRRGFSLIEIVYVLVIVGLVAAVALPRIDVTRYRVNASVQVLGTSVLTAQRQAVTQQHDIIIYVDSALNRIRIHEDRNNNAAIDALEHVRAVNLGERVVFGRGPAPALPFGSAAIVLVRRIGGIPALVFHRDGSASEVGGFYLTSYYAQLNGVRPEDARAVSVERATGRASWFRYRTGAWVKVF